MHLWVSGGGGGKISNKPWKKAPKRKCTKVRTKFRMQEELRWQIQELSGT